MTSPGPLRRCCCSQSSGQAAVCWACKLLDRKVFLTNHPPGPALPIRPPPVGAAGKQEWGQLQRATSEIRFHVPPEHPQRQ